MLSLCLIALGSGVGGVARYLLGGAVQRATDTPFPAGTLAVNVAGSFLLGFLLRWAVAAPGLSPEVRLGLTVGFCGGFTTFSTFSAETIALVELGDYRRAALYVAASLVAALLATAAGFAAARVVMGAGAAGR